MKSLLIITFFCISSFAFGQSPYERLNDEYRSFFDQIPIDKGQENEYFSYAKQLFNKDSLKKAGQIFDRLFWLDTTSKIARESYDYKKIIEIQVIKDSKKNLLNTWNWGWSGTNWGASETSLKSSKTKRIEINLNEIKFFRNDTLVRTTKYILTQRLDWVNGFLTNLIKYNDTNEEWYYHLNGFDTFTSDYLWIEQKTGIVCGNYGESYGINKKNKQIP